MPYDVSEPTVSLYRFTSEGDKVRVGVRYAEGPAEAVVMSESEFARLYGGATLARVRAAGMEGIVTNVRPRP